MAVTISIERTRGYDRHGKSSRPSYVAEITGLSGGQFERRFLEPVRREWPDKRLFTRGKGSWIEHYELDQGIYEVTQFGDRTYYVVYERSGALKRRKVSMEELKAALHRVEPWQLVEALGKLTTRAEAEGGPEAAKTVTLAQAAEYALTG